METVYKRLYLISIYKFISVCYSCIDIFLRQSYSVARASLCSSSWSSAISDIPSLVPKY